MGPSVVSPQQADTYEVIGNWIFWHKLKDDGTLDRYKVFGSFGASLSNLGWTTTIPLAAS